MTEVTIEIDDVQEFIINKVTDGEADPEDIAQNVFDDALWRLYQQWKQADGGGQPVPEPED